MLEQIYGLDLFEYEIAYQQNDMGIKIILSDGQDRLYTSFGNTRGIYLDKIRQSNFVEKADNKKGFIFWDINAPAISLSDGSEKPQIALARALYDLDDFKENYGYMIVTINQQKLFSILSQYKYSENDCLFIELSNGNYIFDSAKSAITIPESVLKEANTLKAVSIDGKAYLLNKYAIDNSTLFGIGKLNLFCLTDYEQIVTELHRLTARINYVAVYSILAIAVIALWVSYTIARPIKRLTKHINTSTPGTRPIPITTKRKDEIGLIYSAYNNMAEQNYQLFEKIQEERQIKEKYYLESLKSKMSPHFLFNTLNSIRWMAVLRNAVNIQNSIDALAAILKYSLSDDMETVTLSQELKIVEDYCYIQETRFGCNCILKKDIPDECNEIRIVKFILQPVVENCFKHAFINKDGNNSIHIQARIQEGILLLSISDSGKGFPEEMLAHFKSPESRKEHLNHLGIHIVDERLRISYGDDYGLRLSNMPDGGACVLYRLPVQKEEEK